MAMWSYGNRTRFCAISAPKSAGGAGLYPAEPGARSQIERWMDWQLAALNGPYLGVFKESKKKEEERAASFAGDAKELAAQLEILEKGTAGRPVIAGANFSIADICLGPIVDRCLSFPVTLAGASLVSGPGETRLRPERLPEVEVLSRACGRKVR